MFVGGPESIGPGESAELSLALMYFPEEDYSEIRRGATFTIREGPLVVGFGPSCPIQNNVLKRHDRSDSCRKIPISLIDRGCVALSAGMAIDAIHVKEIDCLT
jgi:hypothetical protein